NADLTAANLQGAHLTESVFRNANLSGADLTEAILSRTDFHGANLRSVKRPERFDFV
ncbi:MAG TPA: pentapeptide repeat-containing protein, partial [Terriglobia bacterium]|nr:pentapeptide repeat-containing protein [Terriglobia bacterium]